MGKEYINIKNAIDETLFNLMETFDNKIPLDLLGKIIKDVLYSRQEFIILDKKRISPNNFIKKRYGSLSKFIEKETKYNLICLNDTLFISV